MLGPRADVCTFRGKGRPKPTCVNEYCPWVLVKLKVLDTIQRSFRVLQCPMATYHPDGLVIRHPLSDSHKNCQTLLLHRYPAHFILSRRISDLHWFSLESFGMCLALR